MELRCTNTEIITSVDRRERAMCFIFLCLMFAALTVLMLIHVMLCSFLKVGFDLLLIGIVVTILMNLKGGKEDE